LVVARSLAWWWATSACSFRGPAIEQARRGQHFGAGAHADQQRIALGALALQPLDDRGGVRPGRMG
jgi:hypothetical protein